MGEWVTACSNHACVEVGTETLNDVPVILVRDSAGNVCRYTPEEWDEFLDGVRRDVFNHENLEPLI